MRITRQVLMHGAPSYAFRGLSAHQCDDAAMSIMTAALAQDCWTMVPEMLAELKRQRELCPAS